MSCLRKATLNQGCSVAFHPLRGWWFSAALNPLTTKDPDTPAVAINNTESSQSTHCFLRGERIRRIYLDSTTVSQLIVIIVTRANHCS